MLMRQTLGTIARVRVITTVLILYTLAWGATAIFAHIFQCWPVEFYWDRTIKGHCIGHQVILYMCTASLSLGEDVALLLLPVVVVWQLKLVRQQKIQLTVLFSVGALYVYRFQAVSVSICRLTDDSRVCVFSLLRTIELKNYKPTNFTRRPSSPPSARIQHFHNIVNLNKNPPKEAAPSKPSTPPLKLISPSSAPVSFSCVPSSIVYSNGAQYPNRSDAKSAPRPPNRQILCISSTRNGRTQIHATRRIPTLRYGLRCVGSRRGNGPKTICAGPRETLWFRHRSIRISTIGKRSLRLWRDLIRGRRGDPVYLRHD